MSQTGYQLSALHGGAIRHCRVVPIGEPLMNLSNGMAASHSNTCGMLAIPTSQITHIIHPSDLILMEAEGNYTTLFLEEGKKITVSKSIKHLDKTLPRDEFIRIHQSFIVNKTHISFII